MSSQSKPRRKRGGGGGQAKKQSERAFWGKDTATDDDVDLIHVSDDPTVMVRSLGRAPLPGAETIAEHYFAAVYERAAQAAVALAASVDLLDMGDDGEDDE
jgi:hypothetical protein